MFTLIHKTVKEFEAWGILLAIVGFGFAWIDSQHDRELREATLYALAAERLDAARGSDEPNAKKGQKRTLEAMAQIGASISGINASRTNLKGALLVDANLESAIFEGTKLNGARFDRAFLYKANFNDAVLAGVSFDGAT